jgi:hypothetical protein
MTDPNPKPFANTPQFYAALGWFYATWTAVELNIDLAIHKALKIEPEQTHALVGPLEFGRKVSILRSLLSAGDRQNAEQLKGFLTRITKTSLRNVFAHSFLASDINSVTFVHRSGQGQYSAQGYRFESKNFLDHVQNFVQLAHDFENALGLSAAEIGDFAAASLKPKESETPPQE